MAPVRSLAAVALACSLSTSVGAQEFFPLEAVEPGLRGVGRTVFSGEKIEEFGVEILGVLENVGPKQSIILARLSGGPLEKTGVIAGMSGSPVYIDSKLLGAVAFAFPFATEAIAGIRPIRDMVEPVPVLEPRAAAPLALAELRARAEPLLPPPNRVRNTDGLAPIAAPVSFGGFTERTLEVFGERLREIGLRPLQGVGGGGRNIGAGPLEPGSMISVGLITGDLVVTASGTVTYIDGDRLYAFGHPFLAAGPVELPLLRAAVIAVVPSRGSSFKLTAVGPPAGKIVLDRSAGVTGTLGPGPEMVPAAIRVRSSTGGEQSYSLELARDAVLTPFLLQLAIYSAIDANVRRVGAATLRLRGAARFRENVPPLRLDNVFAGPSAVGLQASIGAATPLAYVLQSAGGKLTLAGVDLEIEAAAEERTTEFLRAWTDKTVVRAGEPVKLSAAFRGPGGEEFIREESFRVPPSAPLGRLNFSFADASRLNLREAAVLMRPGAIGDSAELIRAVNRLRPNDRFYIRVWRNEPSFRLRAERLVAAPASVRSVLQAPTAAAGGSVREASSTLAEIEWDGFEGTVRGAAELNLIVSQ